MADIVIFGTGHLAEVALAYFCWEGSHKVIAFTADANSKSGEIFHRLPVLDWENVAAQLRPADCHLFAPISYRGVNALRKRIFQEGKAMGFCFATFVHPNALHYDLVCGENCFILEQNVIQPYASIGDNVVLWSGNHVGHHSLIGDHAFVSSHVVVSGGVVVGPRCFLGVNSTLRDNITLGEGCVISAGALVLNDLKDESVVVASSSETKKVPSSRLRRI